MNGGHSPPYKYTTVGYKYTTVGTAHPTIKCQQSELINNTPPRA
jgi:hypothetical protein